MIDDGPDLGDDKVQLVVGRVEVRGDANAGAGAVVGQDVAAGQLLRDLFAVWDIHHHDAAARLRITARAHREARLIGQIDEPLRLAKRFGADGFDADLVDDLVAGTRRVQRGNVRRAVEEAEDVRRVLDGAAFEGERPAVRHPARRAGTQFCEEVGADVQITGTRTSAQPLHRTAGGEIEPQRADIDGKDPGRLIQIGDDEGADLVGAAYNRRKVLYERTAEGDVGHGHQLRLFVDGGQQQLGGQGDSVG